MEFWEGAMGQPIGVMGETVLHLGIFYLDANYNIIFLIPYPLD